MCLIKPIFVLLLFIFTLIFNCSVFTPETDYIYIVKTIDGSPVENMDFEYRDIDIPLEIKLEDYEMGSRNFKGSVKFYHISWQPIIDFYHGFYVNTKGIFDYVESIGFIRLEITEEKMNGIFMYAGPTLDPRPIEFTAGIK